VKCPRQIAAVPQPVKTSPTPQMKITFFMGDCIGPECGFYDDEAGMCSMVAISKSLGRNAQQITGNIQ